MTQEDYSLTEEQIQLFEVFGLPGPEKSVQSRGDE